MTIINHSSSYLSSLSTDGEQKKNHHGLRIPLILKKKNMKAINDSHHHMFLILMRVYVCMYNKIYIYIIHCKTSYCKQTHFHALYIKPSSLVILPTLYYLPKPMPFGLLASTPSEPKIRRIHRSYMLITENIYNINRGMNEPAHQLLISSQHYCG